MVIEDDKFVENTTLYLKGISKTFGSNKALDNVDIVIMPGEILGLMGKNGCGKSTLIKILSGFHEPDKGGELYINGKPVKLPLAPGEFKKYGMSFVHQDLGLVDSLTVTENWSLAELATEQSWKIDWKAVKEEAEMTFARYNVDISPDAMVFSLGPVQKAMLAILRAVHDLLKDKGKEEKVRGLLVLDEPTVFLPKAQVDTLFQLIRSITYDGISVMFVSHDLDEVISLTDSFVVLRDGKKVANGSSHIVDKNQIIEMILGQKLEEYHVQVKNKDSYDEKKPILNVNEIAGNIVRPASFSVYPGEVLGITGLAGSGFEEIPYLLFGAVNGATGSMDFKGKNINLSKFSPNKAVKENMALIPADRKNEGGVMTLEVNENIMMQSMKHYNPYKLDKRKMIAKAHEMVDDYEVYPSDVSLDFGQLSGGNQQKVLLAKWIQENPDLLILHEPTQGIDIGARQAIYKLIENSVENLCMTVICSSSDYEQLEQICDRVLIMVGGCIVSELVGSEIEKSRITKLCYETIPCSINTI